MVVEKWVGTFTVEYDAVDLEGLAIQAGASGMTRGKWMVIHATTRAQKASHDLRFFEAHIDGEHYGKVTFKTSGIPAKVVGRSSGLE